MTRNTNEIDLRSKVHRLIRDGSSHKLMLGGGADAVACLEEAYRIACDNPSVVTSPWRSVAAYRLAHLILRAAEGERHKLERAAKLLKEARSAKTVLGSWPSTYRLAVLHRLSGDGSGETKEHLIEEVFRGAIDDMYAWRRGWVADGAVEARLQDGVFNAIELASYFLGLKYDPLLGRGGVERDGFAPGPSPWILVGHDRRMLRVELSRAFAIEELEAYGRQNPAMVLFKLSKSRTDFHWKVGGGDFVEAKPEHGLVLLACALRRGFESRKHLLSVVTQASASEDAFRQILKRTRQTFASLTGTETEILRANRRAPRLPIIDETVPILGAVERSVFSRSTRRLPR